jgi:hypothetical protein
MPDKPRKTVGRQVDRLIAGLDIDSASHEEVASVSAQIRALGRDAIGCLARGILRPGPARREKAAALLACLAGEAAAWALAELEGLFGSRRLGPMERVWLLTTVRRLQEAASPGAPDDEAPADEADDEAWGDEVAGLPTDEAELLLWRDEFASLAPTEQEAVLAPMLHSGDAALLPFLEMAVSLRRPRVDAAVAGGLAHFPTRATLPLLRELLRRPDPVIRKRARVALVALERQGVQARDIFVAAREAEEPLLAAFVASPDRAGRMGVLVARGRAPGRVRYAVVVLDLVEVGIEQAWGESGLTEADLHEHISQLAGDDAAEFLPIDPNTAQALVAAGEAYARRQGHELPADYLVWRRCIGKPKDPVRLPVIFGPSCAECGARLRGSDIERGGLVAGEMALCARCAERERDCAACGRSLHPVFDEFAVRGARRGGKLDLLCVRCARSGRRRGKR